MMKGYDLHNFTMQAGVLSVRLDSISLEFFINDITCTSTLTLPCCRSILLNFVLIGHPLLHEWNN